MLETSYPSQVFRGVQFVLLGFNPITESKVRFKLVNGGGVDAGQYNRSCTHVIAGNITYDDPACVAARNDGKTVVTALWVDHSVDIGMPVDAASIMYRPLKDLNGIPGAKDLVVCLTGYLRQDRDDIMTMVSLMGAEFSKPLVSQKVTHLICYKFEGEKYELAKRLGAIKIVNHRWLEDCLKDWVLLPEDKYNKSGYELEIMGDEAKDSEEEAEDSMPGLSGGRNINKSPLGSKVGIAITHGLSKSVREASNSFPDSTGPQVLPNVHYDDQKTGCQDPDVSGQATSCQLPETYVKKSEPAKENANSSGRQLDMLAGTSDPKKLVNDLRSASKSAEGLTYSDAKLNATSNSRKNRNGFALPKNLDQSSGNATASSVSPLDDFKFGNNLETPSSKVEEASERIKSARVEGSGKGNDTIKGDEAISLLPQKRTNEVASTKLKSRKKTANSKLSTEKVPLTNGKSHGLKLTSVVDEPPEAEGYLSIGKDVINNSNICSISKSPGSTSNSPALDMPFLRNASSESAQRDDAYQNSPHTVVQSLCESKINGKPDITGLGKRPVDGIEIEAHNFSKNVERPSPGTKKSQDEEPTGLINLDLSNELSGKRIRKSPRKKPVAKKSLGSRPRLRASAKQKSSVSLNKTIPQADGVGFSSGSKEVASCDAKKLQQSPQIHDSDALLEQEIVSKYAKKAGGGTKFLDDETEAPDDKCDNELGMTIDEKKSESVHLSKKADKTPEDKSEAIHCITESEEALPPKQGTNGTEQKQPSLVNSASKCKVKHGATKRPSGRTKKTRVAKDILTSKGAVSSGKIHDERKHEPEKEILKEMSLPDAINNNSTAPTNNSEKFVEEDKENRPTNEEQNIVKCKKVGNSTAKSGIKTAKVNSMRMNLHPFISEDNSRRVKTEPVCFIVSGHRLQRKEFQQVIRRLKGRVCRDSHQWSYQATHFIAPDPIRRTEKFFAAAASGRWILKTDYLTACSQAGKFLSEEPYEWHKTGLSEDGAINMEAPRKWRLLREKTGHGALYGMRIIVYGDCIAPPLDTLKRVVKAGDGTILATSPPYTRFLNTGVGYAIVSPGMPRVDLWVQEFLKHEVPCVLADYLVEYVCKPGFSLERHVLYGTHAWAERSYAILQSKAEKIIEELTPSEDSDDSDTKCQVCGSRERGDVMLICGDESGSVGCGVGTHIDCCNPPLEEIPDEDWFCPKCCGTRNSSNSPSKKIKKAPSSSKTLISPPPLSL